MPEQPEDAKQRSPIVRGIIEVASIIFLFYSNLLMGQFDAGSGHGKTLAAAFQNIITAKNFTIAIGSALIGYVVFEYLRRHS